MANLITSIRFLLLFVLVWMAYEVPPIWQLLEAPLIIAIFAMDALDGYVARKRGESSLFGSVYDIAVDRIVENVLWIVVADLDFVPVWVPIVFITRGFIVDAIRSEAVKVGEAPFQMTRSAIGRFLVAGRFMRTSYAAVKGAAFAWIFLLQPWPELFPGTWAAGVGGLTLVTDILVYTAVAMCIARALPVVVEFLFSEAGPFKTSARRS